MLVQDLLPLIFSPIKLIDGHATYYLQRDDKNWHRFDCRTVAGVRSIIKDTETYIEINLRIKGN